VYASASGDSNDKGCKPCPSDSIVQFSASTTLDGEDFDSWNNKDEISASILKYSPAGSEGEDSCVANCEYGDYWNGSECTECPSGSVYSLADYEENGEFYPTFKYNKNKPIPQYGDGTDDSVCTECPNFNSYTGGSQAGADVCEFTYFCDVS